jgi:iron complex outermembrane recepter protein
MPGIWQKGISADASGGSFNTLSLNANIRMGDEDHRNMISYSHQASDGYRMQTHMRRDIASWETLLKTGPRQTLHAYLLYGDLFYQTPGALTLAEFMKDPHAARPVVGTQPSAVQARAAIYQKNFTAGFSNEYHFSEHWQNTTALYGAYTDFTNPGIRVYEIRQEPHFGGRTVFRYKTQMGTSDLQLNAGAEAQRGFFETRDYANKGGISDTLQTDDHIGNWQYMIFAQADLRLRGGWSLTAGASFNKSSYRIARLSVRPPTPHTIDFENKIAPRIGLLKTVFPGISLYANAAGGFSTPTVAEVEKSNGIIGPLLQPENGIDYEIGTRGSLFHEKLYFDVNAFFFRIQNAIVQRIDSSGIMYSINAGGTDQHGLETFISYQLTDNPGRFFSNTRVWISDTWHDFHYRNFSQQNVDYSGHRLPGIPPKTIVAGVDITTSAGLYTNITYTYADRSPLNDANGTFASSYNLLGARIGYRKIVAGKFRMDLFAGGDNLFNETYSLGNDINAAAGRYYNAAPAVNYFLGASLNLQTH